MNTTKTRIAERNLVLCLLCVAEAAAQTVNNGPNDWGVVAGRSYQTTFDNTGQRVERHHQIMQEPDYLWDYVVRWNVTEGQTTYDWVEVESEAKRIEGRWSHTWQVVRRISYRGDRTNTTVTTNPINKTEPVIGPVGTYKWTNAFGRVTRTFCGKATIRGAWHTNLWRWNWLDDTNYTDESRLDCWYFHNGSNQPVVFGSVMLHPGSVGYIELSSVKPQDLWEQFRCLPCYPHVPPNVCEPWAILAEATNAAPQTAGVRPSGGAVNLFFPFDNGWNAFSVEASTDLQRWQSVSNGVFEMPDDLEPWPPGIRLTVNTPSRPTFWRLRDLGFSRRTR